MVSSHSLRLKIELFQADEKAVENIESSILIKGTVTCVRVYVRVYVCTCVCPCVRLYVCVYV